MQQPANQPVPLRRRLPAALIVLGAVMLLSACAMPKTPVRPPYGLIYTGYKAPLQTDLSTKPTVQNSANAQSATEPTKAGNLKVGVSETKYLFIPFVGASFGWDDGAVRKAAENGSIKKIHYTDYETQAILGIFVNFKVYAYGE